MMTQKPLSVLISALSLGVMLPATVLADTTKEKNESWIIETVIVTAQKNKIAVSEAETATRTATPLEKIPQSIQVLSRNLLNDQDVQTLSDALHNVSGVTPTSTMQTVLVAPYVRGFSSTYYYDGLPAYQLPAGASDPATLINVERIEVAKGPSSTLYGGGSGAPLAGLINVVSRDPSFEREGEIGLRVGEFGTKGIQGRINSPLSDSVAVSLSAQEEKADSFIRGVNSERYALFPSLTWNISADTHLKLRGQVSHLEQLEYSGLPVELIGKIDRFTFAGAEDAPLTEVDNKMLTASLQHNFSDSLRGDFSVRRFNSDFTENSTYPVMAALGTTYYFGSGQVPSNVEQTFATASLLKQLTIGSTSHQILVGADYDDTDYYGAMGLNFAWGLIDYANPVTNTAFGASPAITEIQKDALGSSALFVQDQISITSKLDVTASLRWTDLAVKSKYTSSGVPFADSDKSESRYTPRIGLTYELIKGVSVFAGYAEGFKGVVAAMGVADPKPETSQSYEAGFKFANPIEGLTGSIALFNVTRQNVITSDPQNAFLSIQTGEQRAKGVETDLIYEPTSQLSLLFNYAYTDAEVTKDNKIPVGDTLRAIPKQKGRLAAHYRFQGTLAPLEIGGGVTQTSSRELTLPNTTSVVANTLFDLQASWDFKVATANLSVVNLTDDDSYEPYQYFGGQYVIPVQPRTVTLSLKKVF